MSSGSTMDWKFKTVQWKPVFQKAQSLEKTLGGGLDRGEGSIMQVNRYVVKVPYDYQEGEEDYGRYSDLIKLYALNNPRDAVDTNLLRFWDHFGNEHMAWITGDVAPEPLTTIIDSNCSWYMIPMEITIKPTALEPDYLVPVVPE